MSDETQARSAVFYIDGSCRPTNPGYIGWGVHGYFYNETTEKPVISEQFAHTTNGYVPATVTTLTQDAKFVAPIEYLDGFGSCDQKFSNNIAEIKALYNLFDYIKRMNLDIVKIYTDSQYLRDCITDWCKRWEKNGWIKQDGSSVSNREFLEPTYTLFKSIKEAKVNINIYWIRAHTGHLGNERADILAGIGMSHSQQNRIFTSFELSPFKGFWKSDAERSPYNAFRRLYFNSLPEYNVPGVYYLSDSPEADYDPGTPSASSSYSVIYLNTPDPIIELVKQKQYEWSAGSNVMALMKLDSIYSKQVYPWLDKYGTYPIVGDRNTHSLLTVDKRPITVQMNPVGLSLRAIDYFSMIEVLLQSFKENSETVQLDYFINGAAKVSICDITDKFFNTFPDKKGNIKVELRPEFVVGYREMKFNINIEHNGHPTPVTIPYLLGLDCLPRNNLKHLESLHPKISLLTWNEDSTIRYATIIESDIGIGIWSNYFANQVILPKAK